MLSAWKETYVYECTIGIAFFLPIIRKWILWVLPSAESCLLNFFTYTLEVDRLKQVHEWKTHSNTTKPLLVIEIRKKIYGSVSFF